MLHPLRGILCAAAAVCFLMVESCDPLPEPVVPSDTTTTVTSVLPSVTPIVIDTTLDVGKTEDSETDSEPLDGRVTKLQTHTQGKGISVVLMGDAYTEKHNTDGTYEAIMKKAADAFFSVEPFTTFRSLFDVYMVNVVSQSSSYSKGVSYRKLGTKFVKGTEVSGDDVACKRYALHAVRPERDDWKTVSWDDDNIVNTEVALGNTLVIVIMNRRYYAGTCYMGAYRSNDTSSDYTQGNSVAYMSLGTGLSDFEAVLHHEANGHGFGYLADEYCYSDTGEIPQSEIDEYTVWQDIYHACLNIDFTSDVEKVNWAHFLSDGRYSDAGLGVFEGAGGYYEYGVYKPTLHSIMLDNAGSFNAPSREQIYKRLLKLAYGKEWSYDYEEFVRYDAVNITSATKTIWQMMPLPHTGRSVLEIYGR